MLFEAQTLAGDLTPGGTWWEAYGLIATSPDLEEEVHFHASATLVNDTPRQAAHLALKAWFPPVRLPDLALEVRDSVVGAYTVLKRLVHDEDLPAEVRIDAAENLTMDPDDPATGLKLPARRPRRHNRAALSPRAGA